MIAFTSRERRLKLLRAPASSKSDERGASGLAAFRLLRRAEFAWNAVLTRPRSILVPSLHLDPSRRNLARTCLRHPGALRWWELRSLRYLPAFPRLLAEQRSRLAEIAERLHVLEVPA
jgi:hypothetical protein